MKHAHKKALALFAVLASLMVVFFLADSGEAEPSVVHLSVPAVDSYGRGALAGLTIKAQPGNNSIFIDAQGPLLDGDALASLNRAVDAALDQYDGEPMDLYYYIDAPVAAVEGGSAGAAFSVGALLALNGLQARGGVIITGTVEANGSIGRVGSILPKAIAAKAAGYELLLVPVGESVVESSALDCVEKEFEGAPYRECVTVTKLVSIANETGIIVMEVATIGEAFELMWQ
jgi:predicted S18 family serine protease